MTHDRACAYQHAPDSQVHIQQQRNKSTVLRLEKQLSFSTPH